MSFDFLNKHTIGKQDFNTQTKFLVPDFIPQQRIIMYWADGGVGKSTLTYSVITYIQTHHKMKMVTIIDVDNPLDELRTKKVDTLLIERYSNLKFIHGSALNRSPLALLDELASYATAPDFYKDCLFVFDSARDFIDVNNDRAVQAFMEQAKKLRNAGATIIILLHGNKDARNYQGSNHFLNSCDCLSRVSRGSSSDDKFSFIIDTSKGRAGAKSCAFSVNTNNYHLEQISYDVASLSNYDVEFIAKVTLILKENQKGINQKNLLEALGLPEDNKAGREALSKFTGKYWKVIKGLKNANFYHLIVEDTAHTEQTGVEHV